MFESKIHHIVKLQRTNYFLIQIKSVTLIVAGHLYNLKKKEEKYLLFGSFWLSGLFMLITLTFSSWFDSQPILLTQNISRWQVVQSQTWNVSCLPLTVWVGIHAKPFRNWSDHKCCSPLTCMYWVFAFHLASPLVRFRISFFFSRYQW